MEKGKRIKIPSTKYRDFVTHTIRKHNPSTSTPATSSFPGHEPRTFKDAMKYSGWRDAMAAEIKTIEEQGTWVLEKLPHGKKALRSKWVYTEKRDEHGNDKNSLSKFKAYLGNCFKIKDLGVLKYFLGLKVAQSKQGFYICQRKYSLDIISEAGLLGAKPTYFLKEQNHKLALVGGRFMQSPKKAHWEAALRVVRYLKKNPGHGILLRSDSALKLEGWCASDWVMNLFCDSQSALYIAQNLVFHERTKHIEVDMHLVRDAIKDGLISPSYVPTKEQLADIFTKALGKAQFESLLAKLGIRDLHAPT
ncbi:uncharacterized protein LOC110719189 [Chenopodium quinoa]|uniref:uncharacterized protein LOC110719189 n=1 Tax=Chenopodium quinoa TaxID=63459 RepID=UPI000B788381|nr:uncharacterized protein LOC110719189 [Chenopodium quinoa]